MASTTQPWPLGTTYGQRWKTARRVALRWEKILLEHANVLSVSVGIEHTGRRASGGGQGGFHRIELAGGQTPTPEDLVPCVTVLVNRKWKSKRVRPGSLPEFLPAFIKVRGRRRRVNVPVDVVAHGPTALHNWDCTAQGTTSLSGTTTAFVRYSGGQQQYLLSCHHVLALTEVFPLPVNNLPEVSVEYEGKLVGSLAALPLDYLSVDAALATANGQAQLAFPVAGGSVALRDIVRKDDEIPADLFIVTRYGVASLQQVGSGLGPEETYFGTGANSQRLRFPDVLYCITSDGTALRQGCSGAAVVTSDGRLVGIHYAGTPGGGPDSFSVKAYNVFAAFAHPLKLC